MEFRSALDRPSNNRTLDGSAMSEATSKRCIVSDAAPPGGDHVLERHPVP